MGLLQEAALVAGDSGYVRDVADPDMVLHELLATAIQTGRPIYVVLGDFKHAFPNTWREALLVLLKRSASVRGGAVLL